MLGVVVLVAWCGAGGAGGAGGAAGEEAWGVACALLDRYWEARCSGGVLAARWALTAAHCVSPRLAYVAYNTRHLAAPVHYLYRHPGYRGEPREAGGAPAATLLAHDVGLVRTRADMRLAAPPPVPPADGIHLYDCADLQGELVDVVWFGRREGAARGWQLRAARLAVTACAVRGGGRHACCGAAACAGASGAPVLYRGAQVALASLGPASCGAPRGCSVFTPLRRYAPLINATVHEADAALRMAPLQAAAAHAPPAPRAPRWRAALAALGARLVLRGIWDAAVLTGTPGNR